MALLSKLSLVVLLLVLSSFNVQAAELPAGVGYPATLTSGDVPDGSILALTAGGYTASNQPYDANMRGVKSSNPSLAFRTEVAPGAYIITLGSAMVRISTQNGDIHRGDLITSSAVAGVGQKANRAGGYVLGTALEDYTGQPRDQVGEIAVAINIQPNLQASNLRTNLLEALRLGVAAPFLSPVVSLRYILAVLVVLVSFALGFVFFGRTSSRGVEALGRNPLASSAIAMSMIFNVGLTAVVVLVGLGIAYLILVL